MLAPIVGATILLCLASMETYNWLINSSRRWGLLWIGYVFWPTLAAENRILKAQLKTRLRLTDAERITLAEIAHRLGRKALDDVANAAKPDTILG